MNDLESKRADMNLFLFLCSLAMEKRCDKELTAAFSWSYHAALHEADVGGRHIRWHPEENLIARHEGEDVECLSIMERFNMFHFVSYL